MEEVRNEAVAEEVKEEVIENVIVGGESYYKEILAQQGYIPRFKWNMNSNYRAHVLKSATTDETKKYIVNDKLPSWVFVEELLGIRLSIEELAVPGDYPYDVKDDVLGNIRNLVNTVKDEELLKSKMLFKNEVIGVGVQLGFDMRDKESFVKNRASVLAVIEAAYKTLKEDFIMNRTTMRLVMTNNVATSVDQFQSGILDRTGGEKEFEKNKKLVRDYIAIATALAKAKFAADNPRISPTSKQFMDKFEKDKFKLVPISLTANKALTFMVTSYLSNINNKFVEVDAPDGNMKVKTLCSYDFSKTKYKKFANPVSKPGGDQEFDFITFDIAYDNGVDEKEQGKNMSVVTSFISPTGERQSLSEKEVFEYFSAAVRNDSYKKVGGMKVYPVEEIVMNISLFLSDNWRYMPEVPGEEKDKLNRELVAKIEKDIQASKAIDSEVEGFTFNPDAKTAESVVQNNVEIEQSDEVVNQAPKASMSAAEAFSTAQAQENVKVVDPLEGSSTTFVNLEEDVQM